MFTQFGKTQSQIDSKNRIRLPAKYRTQFGDKYILLPGAGGCIWLFREDDQETSVLKQLRNLETLDPKRQKEMRILFSLGANKDADEQGRFSLTPDLIKFAGISNEVYFIGNNQKVEIWSAERWEELYGTSVSLEFIDDVYASLSENDSKN